MAWEHHENNIYDKITLWFEVIGKVLEDSAILAENVYNMDETGVMLSMLGFVKVLLGQDDSRDYRGAIVKRTTITAIECISANVLAGGLVSVQNLIKHDAYTLNQVLIKMNNEAKVRRSTRSLVLGKAKVMSFKDIEVARAARAAKDVIKEKGKRGWKRKSAALKPDEPKAAEAEAKPEPKVARASKEVIKGRGKRSRKSKSATQQADEPEPEVARIIDAPVPWRAPVARII
ncbi:hypothetical protein IFR05_017134 [Cadophora sp. M221]|nr:hypothetical protein IFR05_017134 [Cadophora sp. M221]